jgi:hypothetical protein
MPRLAAPPRGPARPRSGIRPLAPTWALALILSWALAAGPAAAWTLPDTGQQRCYHDTGPLPCPSPGQDFYGQDANHQGPALSYRDNGDGTVSDLVTGLMWQKTPDLTRRYTHAEALAKAPDLRLAGYDDWRLPTVKEIYSLLAFYGDTRAGAAFLDTGYFGFIWGDELDGRRRIDAQYATSTAYAGRIFGDTPAMFGVNFADGRIKGYPQESSFFVRYVRGGEGYGVNLWEDNGDGTVSDRGSGLMWQQADSGGAMSWRDALHYCQGLSAGGHQDWRLPNAKELQSMVDYTRAPRAADPARRGPALDPVFAVSQEESWYWSSTTLSPSQPAEGVYLAIGRAFGVLDDRQGGRELVDVHGAGAQRSDPKSGDPDDYPDGRGTQGQNDQVRIYNYARCVRGG